MTATAFHCAMQNPAERGPCEGCPQASRCAHGLACARFAAFVHGGGPGRKRQPEQKPSVKIFHQLFPALRRRR